MLVFSTKLPLKSDITQEMCVQLFIEWVTGSAHYHLSKIPYDISSHEDYHIEKDNISFSIGHYIDKNIELSACRLENREQKAIWFNDCVFLNEHGNKTLLIQLNCNRVDYNTQLPEIHKPYIVRQFIEAGYCRDDAALPVTDSSIIVSDKKFFDICASIMRCEYNNMMPVVYISKDWWGTVISPIYLARQLSGIAHVLEESDREVSFRLRDATGSRNAHNGFIGIYFPGSYYYELFSPREYSDHKLLSDAIINSVWQALINRIDSSSYNWNQIMTLQARQRMMKWKLASAQDKKELAEYMDSFDSENSELREKIEVLNRQNANLRSQLDAMRALHETKEDGFFNLGKERDLYPGEHSDLLYSILSQVENKFDKESRAYCIIHSLLEANTPIGECERLIETLKIIFSGGGRLNSSNKSTIRELGFTIDEDGGAHYKLTFHDPRYMFIVSKTPSDHREGRNLFSDICKKLDINKKII